MSCSLTLMQSLICFPFVRPEICLHLPSDSVSRQTPLVFGYILPATGRIRDFHPLERAPAGRTRKSTFDTTHQKRIALSEGVCGFCGSLCHVCNLYRFCITRHGRCLSFGTFTAHRLRETENISLRLTASNLRIFSGDGRCAGVCVSQCFALSAIHRSVARSCHSSQGEVVQR